MVKIERINGSTLPEVIISLLIASFLIGLISWSLLSMDTRKHIELYNQIIKVQTQAETKLNSIQTDSMNEAVYKVECIVQDSSSYKNTIRKQLLVKDVSGKLIYSFDLISPGDD